MEYRRLPHGTEQISVLGLEQMIRLEKIAQHFQSFQSQS